MNSFVEHLSCSPGAVNIPGQPLQQRSSAEEESKSKQL